MRLLPEFGIEPWILTNQYPGLRKEEIIDDILVRRVRVPKILNGRSFLYESWMLPSFIRFKGDYDLALIASSGIAGTLIRDICNKTVVREETLTDDYAKQFRRKLTGKLRRIIFKRVNHVIVISPAVKKSHLDVSWPEEKMHLIPRGVDHNLFKPANSKDEIARIRNDLRLPQHPNLLFLTVGAIRERKGYLEVIEAWRLITSEIESVYLIIVGPIGDKQYYQKLTKSIRQYGLTSKIIFKGRSERVPEFMQCVDGFVFASNNEGFPNVIIEAMSSNLPIVAYNIDNILPYIINSPSLGILLPRNDRIGFANEVLRIARDPALRQTIGSAAREEVISRFSLQKEAAEHAVLYKRLLNRSS